MSNALYLLAESNTLPAYQFLDEETIAWIKLNIPNEIKGLSNPLLKKYNAELKKLLVYVSDIETNYKNNEVAVGIHGALHACRVAFYTMVINR